MGLQTDVDSLLKEVPALSWWAWRTWSAEDMKALPLSPIVTTRYAGRRLVRSERSVCKALCNVVEVFLIWSNCSTEDPYRDLEFGVDGLCKVINTKFEIEDGVVEVFDDLWFFDMGDEADRDYISAKFKVIREF